MQDISKSNQSTVKKQPRYLLIFLVVAGIVGFLSMFSMCASGDYTKRTYVAEGISMSAGIKAASAEFYEKEKRFPKDNKEAGLAESNQITGQAVRSISIKSEGVIVITYNQKVKDGAEVWLQAEFKEGKMIWQCVKGNDSEKEIKLEYLPANCRSKIVEQR